MDLALAAFVFSLRRKRERRGGRGRDFDREK